MADGKRRGWRIWKTCNNLRNVPSSVRQLQKWKLWSPTFVENRHIKKKNSKFNFLSRVYLIWCRQKTNSPCYYFFYLFGTISSSLLFLTSEQQTNVFKFRNSARIVSKNDRRGRSGCPNYRAYKLLSLGQFHADPLPKHSN